MYSMEIPLMIISINSRSWGVMVIRLVIDHGELVKMALKKREEWEKEWVGELSFGSYWVLWPLCVFGCISVVVVEGACVRGCKELGLCKVGRVD
jgi:hypothetical protein